MYNTDKFDEIKDHCVFGVYGSRVSNEVDMFLALKGSGKEIDYDNCRSALRCFRKFKDENFDLRSIVITSHLIKGIWTEEPKIHFLFYPSIFYLQRWECPSLPAYLYDRAEFLIGDRSDLWEHYVNYRNREYEYRHSLLLTQLYVYASIAVNYFVYFILAERSITNKDIFEKLCYAIRFSVTEVWVSRTPYSDPIDFWDWDDFLEAMSRDNEYREVGQLVHLLRDNHKLINDQALEYLFKQYFRLYSKWVS